MSTVAYKLAGSGLRPTRSRPDVVGHVVLRRGAQSHHAYEPIVQIDVSREGSAGHRGELPSVFTYLEVYGVIHAQAQSASVHKDAKVDFNPVGRRDGAPARDRR
ncbi:MAG: hypothetical protein CL862_01815 [Cyanobium sp. NAT70]|nr:hypothetical protein [Cyanobium sp. NAT70]